METPGQAVRTYLEGWWRTAAPPDGLITGGRDDEEEEEEDSRVHSRQVASAT
jgi:hypothetical protein